MDRIILVTGATGQQGGVVVSHLRRYGWHVRALSPELAKPAVRSLEAEGVEIVAGDFADPASLERALTGIYGLFSVQTWYRSEDGIAEQTRLGIALVEAAYAAGVRQIMYSSVDSAERDN